MCEVLTLTQSYMNTELDSKDSQEHHGALACQAEIGYQLEISQFLSA